MSALKKRKKSANDLLEELGWILKQEDELFIVYEWRNKYNVAYKLIFVLEHQCVELSGYGMYEVPFVRLKRNDLNAINKKMEELGWKI